MTTETILTNYQIHSILHDNFLPFSTQTEGFARAIEQAVLQSPEVQELREDALRYQWIFEADMDAQTMTFETLIAGVALRNRVKKYADAAIDAAIRSNKHDT